MKLSHLCRRASPPALPACYLSLLLLCPFVDALAAEALPVKVVVVSMFENGELTGDRPGEFQLWVERLPLDRHFEFPLGEYPLRGNADGVLGVCVGGGIANATASVMALGLDPRFDLSRAYWLIAGIAGGDPEDVSLGSAVWARHVVDGDLLYEIDAREIPADWPYGLIPLGGERPAQTPQDIYTGWTLDTVHFALNDGLARWAYLLTRGHALPDDDVFEPLRRLYTGQDAARRPPAVLLGDTLSSSTYWHGALMNRWANDWVKLYAGDDAEFMTTNMEDSGTLTALGRLGRIGRTDPSRVLVLRTVSNFSMPPAGKSADWSATAPYPGNGLPALEADYRVGRVVVDELVAGWPAYGSRSPSADGTAPAAAQAGAR